MTIGILLLTHNDIGAQLLLAAKSTYGSVPIRTEVLSIDHYDKPSDLISLAKQYVKLLDQGSGVLILTDMFGSTPSNIAKEFSYLKTVKIISGVNLSMLLNIFNYPILFSRASSLFGDELVLGTFIYTFYPLCFFYLTRKFKINMLYKLQTTRKTSPSSSTIKDITSAMLQFVIIWRTRISRRYAPLILAPVESSSLEPCTFDYLIIQ